MDVLLLSRIQFAVTIAFHYIYPPISIGLGLIIVIMESMYMITKKQLYHDMTKFWVKIFGLNFAIGVATGIVMEFQFGTNWATYSRYVGDVFGSALAAEGVFAFFLESGFLAILLFGWNKVSKFTHWLSALLVCLGAHFSAVWIVVAGSWMQTPAGYHIVGEGLTARAEITDFWAMVFNPSSMERLLHVVLGAWAMGAFFVLSVSAYYLLKKKHEEFAKVSMQIGLVMALIACSLQFISGRISAEVVAKYQPTKLVAMEGHYAENAPADFYLVGTVDAKNQKVDGVKIPGLLSYLVHDDANTPINGIKSYDPKELPPVAPVFQFYHLMILAGVLMFLLAVVGIVKWIKGSLWNSRLYFSLLIPAVMLPQIANQCGWFAAEMGRQPWIVYGLLRTSDALSKVVKADAVLISLIMFTLIYILLFVLYIFLLDQKIKNGPDHVVDAEGHRA